VEADAGISWPCTPARTQSIGKVKNQDVAPENPPAIGMANDVAHDESLFDELLLMLVEDNSLSPSKSNFAN